MQVEQKSEVGIVGKHVYGNLYDCDPDILCDLKLLKKLVSEASKIAKMTLVELRGWRFGGEKGGVSVIALVVESHLALHTWPSYRYATLDIFTCGDKSDPFKAFDYLCGALKPGSVSKHYADRSSDRQQAVGP